MRKCNLYFLVYITNDVKKEQQDTLRKLSEQKIEPTNSDSKPEPQTESTQKVSKKSLNGHQIESKQKLTREEKKEEKKFVETMMYGLTAPILFGSRQWASSYPQKQREYASIIRLAKAIECYDTEMCTLTDVVAFFYPLSMDAPLRHEYYKMYLYAYKHGLPTEWKALVASEPDIDRDTELHENEHAELRMIRTKIFRKQMEYVKSHD